MQHNSGAQWINAPCLVNALLIQNCDPLPLERVQTAFLCPDFQCFWTFAVVGANFAIKTARTRTPNFDAAHWISGFWHASNPSVFQ